MVRKMKTESVRPIDKFVNLTLDKENNIIGTVDHRRYGVFDSDNVTFPNPTEKGKRTTFQLKNIHTIECKDGIVTVNVKGNKPTNKTPQFNPTDNLEWEIDTIIDDEPIIDDPVPVVPATQNDDIVLPKGIKDLQAKITTDQLRINQDDFNQWQLVDLESTQYAMIQRDLKTICFYDRGGNPKYDLRPSIRTITKIDLSEEKKLIVEYTDGTQAEYNPHMQTVKTEKPTITPTDIFDIPDYQNVIIPDGSFTSIEECVIKMYGREKLEKCLYTNILDERIYFDSALIGDENPTTQPYNGNRELTKVIQQLEQYYSYEEKGRLKRPKFPKKNVEDVLIKLGMENRKNPFMDLIEHTEYKGTFHPGRFLIDIGCTTRLPEIDDSKESESYLYAVSCAMFLAIIERQKNLELNRPIRFVPILIGDQGIGKSTLCVKMGLDQKGILHKESTVSIDDKKTYFEEIDGCIISEIAEGTQFILGKQNAYKAYFDDNYKHYRKPYERTPVNLPKHWLEIITSNDNEILTDVTGNDRYYPIFMDGLTDPVIRIQDHTVDDMLQFYACALEMYERGERWHTYVENPEIKRIADKIRLSVTQEIKGLLPIEELAKSKDVGETLSTAEMRYLLGSSPYWYSSDVMDKAIKMFGKACNRYGYRKMPTPKRVTLPSGDVQSSRYYQKVKEIS